MKKIFGTFNRFINHTNVQRKLVLGDLVDEFGEKMEGEAHIDNQMVIGFMDVKFGARYMIGYKNIQDGVLIDINETRKLRKRRSCDIFRRFKDEYHFIGGKHQGKKDGDLDKSELSRYCIWLVRNSYNEVTLKNALQILKQIHEK